MTSFCKTGICALFVCSSNMCTMCYSMYLARHIQASSWHAVLALLQAWLNAIRHQYVAQCCAPRLNAVHWQLIDIDRWMLNAVHWQMCIRHQYGSMLCINVAVYHASIWLDAVHLRHQYGFILCIRHQYGPMWPIAVYQASLRHNMPQCCAGIYLWLDAIHQTSQYSNLLHHVSIRLDVVHPWLKLCTMHQFGSMQHNSLH